MNAIEVFRCLSIPDASSTASAGSVMLHRSDRNDRTWVVHECQRIAEESPLPFMQVGEFLDRLEQEILWTHDEFLNLRREVIRLLYDDRLV